MKAFLMLVAVIVLVVWLTVEDNAPPPQTGNHCVPWPSAPDGCWWVDEMGWMAAVQAHQVRGTIGQFMADIETWCQSAPDDLKRRAHPDATNGACAVR